MKTNCKTNGCEKPAYARGWCRGHYNKWWNAQNRESRQASNRRYYERNLEERRAANNESSRKRRANPDRRAAEREAERRRYHANPEKARARKRAWYYANREKSQERSRLSMRKARAAEFGLTLEELEAILARGCAICGSRGEGYSRSLHLDHDHKNGKVRDALCHGCNTALGSMQDDPARLRAAADYLEKHR